MKNISHNDRSDMQGLLVYGYQNLQACYYILFEIENTSKFKQWLSSAAFCNGLKSPKENCINIAFTSKGLQQLTGSKDLISKEAGFDLAFIEGMDTDHRKRILGDYDLNDPKNWKWGHRSDDQTHGILMVFATNEIALNEMYEKNYKDLSPIGARTKYIIKSSRLPDNKEHFGFKDGVSQPVMRGFNFHSRNDNYVNPGEFILGHENEYEKLPVSPSINKNEIGKNGSYMVVREIEQDVQNFWKTICNLHESNGDKSKPIKTASEMLGRWPNGIPLVFAETQEEAEKLYQEKSKELREHKVSKKEGLDERYNMTSFLNDFNYYKEDPQGLKCPLGAHIRRANPKDSSNEDKKEPNKFSNRHRMIRRGRPYGKPLAESMKIEDIIKAIDKVDNESRGLTFICFNSDIKRQFEFVQQTWLNNIKFLGLYSEVDPIAGVKGKAEKIVDNKFTEPACPVRSKYYDLPSFIKIKGGSYFFLPGIQAIKFLATKI
jgi:Dyp-type peroxidase family